MKEELIECEIYMKITVKRISSLKERIWSSSRQSKLRRTKKSMIILLRLLCSILHTRCNNAKNKDGVAFIGQTKDPSSDEIRKKVYKMWKMLPNRVDIDTWRCQTYQ